MPGGRPRIVIMRIWLERSSLHSTDPGVLQRLSEESAAETQKPPNRDLELQIGGGTPAGRCRRGLHLLRRLLHNLHDEGGGVHPLDFGFLVVT